jgi:hypothetical protein
MGSSLGSVAAGVVAEVSQIRFWKYRPELPAGVIVEKPGQ